MKNSTEAKWRRLVSEQEQSGQTAKAFAACRGVSLCTLYWWRSRLSRQSTTTSAPPTAPALVPIAVRDDRRVGGDARPRTAAFELHLRGDLMIRVPAGFDDGDLRRLLEALQPC
jgi:hypothetical protein